MLVAPAPSTNGRAPGAELDVRTSFMASQSTCPGVAGGHSGTATAYRTGRPVVPAAASPVAASEPSDSITASAEHPATTARRLRPRGAVWAREPDLTALRGSSIVSSGRTKHQRKASNCTESTSPALDSRAPTSLLRPGECWHTAQSMATAGLARKTPRKLHPGRYAGNVRVGGTA